MSSDRPNPRPSKSKSAFSKTPQITIKEVAQAAEVSITTASYALNDEGRISVKTRARIKKIAQDLGYRPHSAARALKGIRSKTIGVFVDGIVGPVNGEIVQGIQDTCFRLGYSLLVGLLTETAKTLASDLVQDGWISGAIILTPMPQVRTLVDRISQVIPTVLFDPPENDPEWKDIFPRCLQVRPDNRNGMKDLIVSMVDRGYRSALWVDGTEHSRDNFERKSTFLEAAKSHAIETSIVPGFFRLADARQAVLDWFRAGNRAQWIAASNDEMALGALQALNQVGLSVPRDVVLTGFDDIESSRSWNPSLTTVTIDRIAMGRRASERLVEAMELGAFSVNELLFETSLTIRESSGSTIRS